MSWQPLQEKNAIENYSKWSILLKKELDELTKLPIGWDCYNGGPISSEMVNVARSLLIELCQEDVPPPGVVPGGDGSIQLEWFRRKLILEILILEPNVIEVACFDRLNNTEEVFKLGDDYSRLNQLIGELNRKL